MQDLFSVNSSLTYFYPSIFEDTRKSQYYAHSYEYHASDRIADKRSNSVAKLLVDPCIINNNKNKKKCSLAPSIRIQYEMIFFFI